jgi:hypothetical protein
MAPIKKTPVKKSQSKKKTSAPAKTSVVKVRKPISKTKVAVGLAGLAALGTAAFLGNKYLKTQVPGTAKTQVPLQMEDMNTEDSIILKQIEDLMKITNINDLNNECANLKNKNSKFHDKIVNTCKVLIDKLSAPPSPPATPTSSSPRMSLLEQIQAGKSLKSAPSLPATPTSSSPRISVASSRTSVSSNLSDEIKKGMQLKKSSPQTKTIVKSDLIKRLEQARIANEGEDNEEQNNSEWL